MISVPQKASGDNFVLISLQGNKTYYDCWAVFCFKSESKISKKITAVIKTCKGVLALQTVEGLEWWALHQDQHPKGFCFFLLFFPETFLLG